MGGIPSILLPKGNTTKTDHSFLRVVCFCMFNYKYMTI